jgi:transcriptional regulator with XRE-family HTH domain
MSILFRKKYVNLPYLPSEFRYNMCMTTLGKRLRELRTQAKLTQGQLEAYAGVSQSTISDLERGQIAPKTVDAIVNLAKYYDCSVDFLLGLTDNPSPLGRLDLPADGLKLISLYKHLSDIRRLELLRIAETLYDLEQEAAANQPDLIEETLERIRHGTPARIIGEDPR